MRAIFALTLVITANAVSAQNVESCVQIENDLQRLLCYDQLFKPSEQTDARTQSTPAARIVPVVPAEASDSATPPAPASSVAQAVSPEINVAPAVSSTAEKTQQQLIDSFGAEDLGVAQKTEELSKIESVVEDISENRREIRTFTLSNGQIWRETESSGLRIKVGMPIYIEKGALSAHFLGKESSNRRVRVKRVK